MMIYHAVGTIPQLFYGVDQGMEIKVVEIEEWATSNEREAYKAQVRASEVEQKF